MTERNFLALGIVVIMLYLALYWVIWAREDSLPKIKIYKIRIFVFSLICLCYLIITILAYGDVFLFGISMLSVVLWGILILLDIRDLRRIKRDK